MAEETQDWTVEELNAWIQVILDEPKSKTLEALAGWLLPPSGCSYTNPSGLKLHFRYFLPQQAVKATVFWCHGLHTHVNRRDFVDGFFADLTRAGFAVIGLDCEGHGHSEGDRGVIRDFQTVFDDWVSFVEILMGLSEPLPDTFSMNIPQQALAAVRERPFFFSAESMGGTIAMHTSLRMQQHPQLQHRFRGAVLIAPALKVDLPPLFVQKLLMWFVAPCLGSRIMPRFVSSSSQVPKSWELNMNKAFSREACAMQIRDDASRFPGVGLGWEAGMCWYLAVAFALLFMSIEERMREVAFPVLFLHDPGDRRCYIGGSKRCMEICASQDKTLVEMPGALHAMLINEAAASASKIVPWLLAHVGDQK